MEPNPAAIPKGQAKEPPTRVPTPIPVETPPKTVDTPEAKALPPELT